MRLAYAPFPPPMGEVYTFADLERLPVDGRRYELIDGSIIVSPAPVTWHQVVARRIRDAIAQRMRPEAGLHAELGVGLHVGDDEVVPDVTVAAQAPFDARAPWLDPVDIVAVVEVESRFNRRVDRTVKPEIYASAGITTYLRVEMDDEGHLTLVTHELRDGRYAETGRVTGSGAAYLAALGVRLTPAEIEAGEIEP
ncbi:MAG: Uma2 family endonuclease [Acidimicrobiales bacterium]